MSRLIFIIVIIALAYLLFKIYRKQLPKQDEQPKNQDMVSCAQCGVHIPKIESLLVNGKYYCSNEHSLVDSDKQGGK